MERRPRKATNSSEFPDGDHSEQNIEKYVRHIPTIHYWYKTYGVSLGGQDQKAVRAFQDYESLERCRRLQAELKNIKDGKVTDQILDIIIGKKRKMKYGSYEKWGGLMLLWMANYRK